jgi:hypothetical protein
MTGSPPAGIQRSTTRWVQETITYALGESSLAA